MPPKTKTRIKIPKKLPKKSRCQCITAKGTQCKFSAQSGSNFCGKHTKCRNMVMNFDEIYKDLDKQPDFIVEKILSEIDRNSIVNVCSTNKRFRDQCKRLSNNFWGKMIERDCWHIDRNVPKNFQEYLKCDGLEDMMDDITDLQEFLRSYKGEGAGDYTIDELKNLEKLIIEPYDAYDISRLPEGMGRVLRNLKELQIYETIITDLPSTIGLMKNLEHLYIQNTRLDELPAEIGDLDNLEELFIIGSELEELPSEIGNLKNLRTLILEENPELKELPNEIYKLNLTKFKHN